MKTTTKPATELAVGDQLVRHYTYIRQGVRLYELEHVATVIDTRGRQRVQAKSGPLVFVFRLTDQVQVITDDQPLG